MENQKVYEIIRIEKEMKKDTARTATFGLIVTVSSALLGGMTISNFYNGNNFYGLVSLMGTICTLGGLFNTAYSYGEKCRENAAQIKVLKRQAGINENR